MKVIVRFALFYDKQEKFKENSREFQELTNLLDGFRRKETWIGEPVYEVYQDDELYQKVVNYVETNLEDDPERGIQFDNLCYVSEITEEEYDNAAAFIVDWPDYYCEEYEEIENAYEECETCYSKIKKSNLFYVQPKGYIKKHHEDFGMAGFDGTGELLLLPKLVEALIKGGVDKKYFQPVLTKRRRVMGYIFVTENILPKGSYQDLTYNIKKKCNSCGHINMEIQQPEFWFQKKTISKEGVEKLEDVNVTYEFFDEYREIIVSRKVADIIKKHVKYAEFIPVFLEDESERTTGI